MRQGNAFLLHVYACHAGGLTIKRALLPLGMSKERGWWKDAMPQRREVLLGSRGRWWRRTWAAGPRSGVRSRGVSEDLEKDITQACPLLLCREAPDTTLLSPPLSPQPACLPKGSALPSLPIALLCPDRGGPMRLRADFTLPGQQERRWNRGKQGTEPSSSPCQALDRPLFIHLPWQPWHRSSCPDPTS